MNTLLYIGANIDLTPVLFFKDIKNFIFIDCVPFSNYGNSVALKEEIMTTIYASINEIDHFKDINELGDKDFLFKLEKVMNQNNFILVDENKIDSYLLFRNEDRMIKYYINRAFPQFLTFPIIQDIKDCNILYISGHDPDKSVFNFMRKPFTIVGCSGTVYRIDSNDENFDNSAINYLAQNHSDKNKYYYLELLNQKKKKYLESKDDYKLIKCMNIRDFIVLN